ncbi:MAG TPA: hypothetical protein PK293_03015 [Spirochaetota bacterium]|nr:hypothetical protein [Spirochaetota bacterium]HPF04986.1 hypothetical protein [Spirochaetota bacterium]HPR37122.1 hypothetical protein [Spirochaetota bacterium]
MKMQDDFRELLELLNEKKAEYLVIGAFALAFYGVPRYTGDLDLLVKPSPENAKLVLSALNEFGFSSSDLTEEDFSNPGIVIQLGYPPVRIDLITSITGVSWDEAFSNSLKGPFDDITVRFIGKKEFIKNKKAIGRLKDLADIEAIGGDNN